MIVITKSYHELIIFSRVHKQTILTGLPSSLAAWWFLFIEGSYFKGFNHEERTVHGSEDRMPPRA